MKQMTHIPKFRRFVIQNFPFIEEDFDALTDYGLICKIVEFLNTVIDSQNDLSDNFTELNNAYIELHDYVEHYFDNLDVQQEINNKLEVMAQDGSLTAIIKNYIDPIYQAYEAEINQTLTENIESQNNRISQVEREVSSAVNGAPLVASSTADMTDTNRIYVNSTNGHWYYYNGSTWVDAGVYQSVALDDKSVDIPNLVSSIQEQLEQIQIADEDIEEYSNGNYLNVTTSGTTTYRARTDYSVYGPIELFKNDIVSFTAQVESTISVLALDNGTSINDAKQFWTILTSADSTLRTYTTKVNYTGKYYIVSKNAVGVTNLKIYRLNKTFKNDDTENIKDYISNIIIDNSNPSNFERGHYIRFRDGAFINGTNLYTTDYLEISDNTKITLNSQIPSWYTGSQTPDISGYAFYDENKSYLSGIQRPAGVQKLEIDVPSSAKYIRLSLCEGQIINGFKLYYSDLVGDISKIKETIKSSDGSIERTIGVVDNAVFIGDSLTYGQYYTSESTSYRNFYNYPYFAKKLMNINTIEEYARPGATSSSWWSAYSNNITATNSVYFVWLGTNDNFTDTIDSDCVGDDYTQYANTETGNMGKILQKIRSLEGNKIILLNCVHSGNHLTQTNQMINKFAERFNVELVIDLNNSDARNPIYHIAYNGNVNNVHYNDKGNNYIANIVNQQFKQWLNTNQFEMIKVHE